jgi:hypothetical protein
MGILQAALKPVNIPNFEPVSKQKLKRLKGHRVLIQYRRPDSSGRKCGFWNVIVDLEKVYNAYVFVEYREKKYRLYTNYIMVVEKRD